MPMTFPPRKRRGHLYTAPIGQAVNGTMPECDQEAIAIANVVIAGGVTTVDERKQLAQRILECVKLAKEYRA